MALIHSFTSMVSPKGVASFTNRVTPDLWPLFSVLYHLLPLCSSLMFLLQNGDRVIGVAKKSCLCCYWLGQLLQTDTKEPFVLPGTHGIILPWTPPLDGIPFNVLESLQQKLVSKLVEVTTIRLDTSPGHWQVPASRPMGKPVGDPSHGSRSSVGMDPRGSRWQH